MAFRLNVPSGPPTSFRFASVAGVPGPQGPPGPAGPSGVVTFSGDLAGTGAGPQTVIGIQGNLISGSPSDGQVLKFNAGSGHLVWSSDTNLPSGTGIVRVDSGVGSVITEGTADQLFGRNHGNTADTFFTLGGDATLSNAVLTLANTAVTPGTYGDASHVARVTVDSKGRITAASNVVITGAPPSGAAGGDLSGTYPNPTVIAIQGTAVSNTAPSDRQILMLQSSWTPKNVSNLMAWYRADLGVTLSSGMVTAWADQSGNGDANRNLTSSTAPNYVSSDSNFNNHPTIDFSVASSYLRSGIWSASRNQPITVFIVGKSPGTGSNAYWVDARVDTGSSQQAIIQTSANNMRVFAGGFVTTSTTLTSATVAAAVFNSTSSKAYTNSVTANATGDAGTQNCDGITVGNYAGGGGFNQNGNIAEVIVYSGALSAGDFDTVMGYLGNRYAITVTGGTPPPGGGTWTPVNIGTDIAAADDSGHLNVVSITGSSDSCSILCDNLTFAKTTTGAALSIAGQTTDAATHSMFVHGQDAWSSATTNINGGDVHITAGSASQVALSSGTGGNIYLTSGFPGPLAGPAFVYVSNGQMKVPDATTDVSPTIFQITGSSAWGGASTNKTGGTLALLSGSSQTAIGYSGFTILGGVNSAGGPSGTNHIYTRAQDIGGYPGDPTNNHIPWAWQQVAVPISASGTTSLTTLQTSAPGIIINTVTLTGAVTIEFPNQQGFWMVDISAISSLSASHTLSMKSGSTTVVVVNTSLTPGQGDDFIMVWTQGNNTIRTLGATVSPL